MMLIPIGHDQGGLRRWPAVSFTIIGLCLAVAFVQYDGARTQTLVTKRALQEAVEYYGENPDLQPSPELPLTLARGLPIAGAQAGDGFGEPLEPPLGNPASRAERQQKLDALTQAWIASSRDNMIWHWGLIPAAFSWLTLVTSMFVHAGVLHLLFNMLFLYMTGPLIEDVWGRPVFLAFYLLCGMFAGGMFAWGEPDLAVPLVGASGAIAGVMGAFLVRYPTAKIKLMTFLVWRRLIFNAPAWLLISLWFIGEYVEARTQPKYGGGMQVANWAHVWGFAFGATVAAAIGFLRLEDRYFFEVIEKRREASNDPLQFRLDQLLAQGNNTEACRLLAVELLRRPGDADLGEMYWRLARGGPMATQPWVCLRIIENDLQQRREDLALERWFELERVAPHATPDTHLTILMAQCLAEHGRRADANDLVVEGYRRLSPSSSPQEWGELAQYCIDSGSPVASQVVARALAHPRLPAEIRESLQQAQRPPNGLVMRKTA